MLNMNILFGLLMVGQIAQAMETNQINIQDDPNYLINRLINRFHDFAAEVNSPVGSIIPMFPDYDYQYDEFEQITIPPIIDPTEQLTSIPQVEKNELTFVDDSAQYRFSNETFTYKPVRRNKNSSLKMLTGKKLSGTSHVGYGKRKKTTRKPYARKNSKKNHE